ncbi:uncharacterized protein SPAPADRAFT_73156 [Spathaspora passalidarum NRRL Y-27907]|uniref:Magnesium transporter n=1 Tax=Spathaspora passalidarum (strain NRRL Y-27907 / 11-Y1) TaxID=619300 RepID=G3AU43_SPAPN|nr:uncharacterized protein SPAPADRAFT_73156 [Spathaspora passalidarum NRRL Y-27907]EGW30419.1 hypothetical protein SPAPADRAFT_73156 [Spathaspora passalidarum NRRL Y-27907]
MTSVIIDNNLGRHPIGCPHSSIPPGEIRRQLCRYSEIYQGALPPKRNTETFQDLFISKTLSSTKHTESEHIRCTIFDQQGSMVQHGKEIRKSEFMKQHNLVPRDFRKLSRHQQGLATNVTGINLDIVPSIVARQDSILLNILNIRAMIKHDMVVVFDSTNGASSQRQESYSHSTFLKEMDERLSGNDSLPYEFRALEAILISAISNLTIEMKVHQTVLSHILSGLDDSIERYKLRYLLIQSKKTAQFQRKAILIRDLLEDLLERDDELNDLYLTNKGQGQPRQGSNHAEIEMLLESYYKTADEIVQTMENLKSQIKTTEEIINIVLDSNRNELMLLGLKFSTGLLSMGIALYISALYGMNLENFIEESNGGFEVVVVVSVISLAVLLRFGVKQLRKLEKITMDRAPHERSKKLH